MKTNILRVILVALLITPSLRGQEIAESDELVDQIWEYGLKGYDFVQHTLNLDSAEYYLLKALDLQYSSPGYIKNDRVAANHIALASVYRRFFNYRKAIYHNTLAEDILIIEDPNSIHFASIYHNKGNIYYQLGDLYKTKEYYEYALDFMTRNDYLTTGNFSHVLANYIRLLFEIDENELAEEILGTFDLSELTMDTYSEFGFNITSATTYSKNGKYNLALQYFDKSREILRNQPLAITLTSLITYYFNRIDFHFLYEEYDKAFEYCKEAMLFFESLDRTASKEQILFRSEVLFRIATINYVNGDIKGAMDVVNLSIKELNQFFKEFNFSGGKILMSNKNSSLLPSLYILKSRILHDIYLNSNDINDLKESLAFYQVSIEALNSLKLSMKAEESKIFATSTILEVYSEAAHVGKLLFEKTGDISFLEKAFKFTESSKSFALFSEINNLEAIEFSDLPSEVKKTEEELSGKIHGYENMLYEEVVSNTPDSSKIAFCKDKLFHLQADHDDLLREMEEKYPKYFEFKYEPHFISLEELQDKLPHRDALIEYVLTDSMLITYVIDSKNINVFSQEIDPGFEEECMEYYQLLNKQNFSNGVKQNYQRFVELGRKFYSILVEPSLQYTDRKNLTIVPDGAITYLPFEGFITDVADDQYINYLTLPYLIREYSVGYSQSATLMFSERSKSIPTEDKVLAFAPLYPNHEYDVDTATYRQIEDESELLLPLGGIIKEVRSIKEMVPSRIFMNEHATEAKFKELAPDYNVLHLAMHTIMKDDKPLESWLAFTTAESPDPADTIEDNRLYAYEIYNLALNADMAVLSSCNSGFGKMHKGEGMMSLARGFYYAGCPSIVMTLWQVSDKSSSELMTDFYKHLKKGKSKQEAMRLAKIDYLNSSDDLTSNPYFWSGFVVLGDSSPIYKKTGIAYWISILALFIGLLIFVQYKRK